MARLSDLNKEEWKKIFLLLESDQARFTSLSSKFLSPEYVFPHDPLHTWSRCWEYPYIYSNVINYAEKIGKDSVLHVVDVGSGVTFMPFSLASQGIYVTCADIDPVCERDLSAAVPYIPHAPGQIDFRLTDGKHLPFDSGVVDAIYSISVLEHVLSFEQMISEMARILKSNGALFLTFDLDLRGDHEMSVEKYYDLKSELGRYFNFLFQETSVHPLDILVSTAGPYGYKQRRKLLDRAWFFVKQQVIKPLLGRKSAVEVPYYLAVEGLALVKR